MKNLIHSIVLSLSSVFLVFVGSNASADEYIGSFCWALDTTDSAPDDINTLKLALNNVGDFHLALNGYVFSPGETATDFSLLSGNGEIIGDEFVISLHGTDHDEEFGDTESIGINGVLSLGENFLDGDIAGIVTAYEDGESSIEAFTGTLTFVACP